MLSFPSFLFLVKVMLVGFSNCLVHLRFLAPCIPHGLYAIMSASIRGGKRVVSRDEGNGGWWTAKQMTYLQDVVLYLYSKDERWIFFFWNTISNIKRFSKVPTLQSVFVLLKGSEESFILSFPQNRRNFSQLTSKLDGTKIKPVNTSTSLSCSSDTGTFKWGHPWRTDSAKTFCYSLMLV